MPLKPTWQGRGSSPIVQTLSGQLVERKPQPLHGSLARHHQTQNDANSVRSDAHVDYRLLSTERLQFRGLLSDLHL